MRAHLIRTSLEARKEQELLAAYDRISFLEEEISKYRALCRRAATTYREQMLELMTENAKLRVVKIEDELPLDDAGGDGDQGGPGTLEDLPPGTEKDLGSDDPGSDPGEAVGSEDEDQGSGEKVD